MKDNSIDDLIEFVDGNSDISQMLSIFTTNGFEDIMPLKAAYNYFMPLVERRPEVAELILHTNYFEINIDDLIDMPLSKPYPCETETKILSKNKRIRTAVNVLINANDPYRSTPQVEAEIYINALRESRPDVLETAIEYNVVQEIFFQKEEPQVGFFRRIANFFTQPSFQKSYRKLEKIATAAMCTEKELTDLINSDKNNIGIINRKKLFQIYHKNKSRKIAYDIINAFTKDHCKEFNYKEFMLKLKDKENTVLVLKSLDALVDTFCEKNYSQEYTRKVKKEARKKFLSSLEKQINQRFPQYITDANISYPNYQIKTFIINHIKECEEITDPFSALEKCEVLNKIRENYGFEINRESEKEFYRKFVNYVLSNDKTKPVQWDKLNTLYNLVREEELELNEEDLSMFQINVANSLCDSPILKKRDPMRKTLSDHIIYDFQYMYYIDFSMEYGTQHFRIPQSFKFITENVNLFYEYQDTEEFSFEKFLPMIQYFDQIDKRK